MKCSQMFSWYIHTVFLFDIANVPTLPYRQAITLFLHFYLLQPVDGYYSPPIRLKANLFSVFGKGIIILQFV